MGLLTLNNIKSFLEQFAEYSESVYWLGNPDFTHLVYISPAYEKIWGRSRNDLYNDLNQWITFLHPDDRKPHPIWEMKQKIVEQGLNARYEKNYRVIRPGGEVRWIIDRGFPISDETGKIIAVTGVAVDVTQEKRQEEVIYRENKSVKEIAHITAVFLKNITESLPQYVFWKDTNSVYLGCNKNFSHLVGLHSPEEIIGKTDHDINWQPLGHTTENFRKGDQDTISGHPVTNQEEILVLPNGKTLITLVSKLPIVDKGKVIGIVGYFTDITEIKQKEKELIKARQQAEAANQAKSVFITNISHDIRTPLAGMIGMAKIIAKEMRNSQKSKNAANNLLKAGNILLDLLNQVIEITKLDSGDLPVYEVKFSLRELINNLVILVTPSVQEKKLNLNSHYDDRIPDYLIGDQTRIHRILLNLITNAIKFTSQGKIDLIIKLAKENERSIILKIIIKDTGIGIPPEKQQIIFSRFHRLDPAYKGNYKGSGLGLSIVKQFISEIDGEIYVESEAGKGSQFTCIIPLKKTLLNDAENKMVVESDGQFLNGLKDYNSNINVDTSQNLALSHPEMASIEIEKAARVLVVEDNKISQIAIKNQLEELGCRMDVAGTGEEAFLLFKENLYDLVFMDIGLPDKSGCEVAKEMRDWENDHGRHTPIVALTAHIDQNNKQECLNAGIKQVFTKPLTDEDAQNILNTFVSSTKNAEPSGEDKSKIHSTEIPIIDLKLGSEIMGGNENSAKEMLKMLVDSLPETEDNIKKFYKARAWKQLKFTVHKLNGGVCYCGVPRLKISVIKMEEALKAKDDLAISQRYEALIIEIQNLLLAYQNQWKGIS